MQTDATTFRPAMRALPAAAVDALAIAHARSVDAREGLARLSDRHVAALARIGAMHARHAASLGALLIEAGGATRGTRTAVALGSLSALLDGAGAELPVRLRHGEGRVLAAFDAALACDLPCTTLARLRAMRAEIADLIVETRSPA